MTRIASLGFAALLLACADVTPPERPAPYAFAIDCAIPNACAPQAGALRLVFRWPHTALPVRVWVAPVGDMPLITDAALRLWRDAMLYGELRLVRVRDSSLADVLVSLRDAEIINGPPGEVPLDCRGQTDVAVDLDTTIVLPFAIRLAPRLGSDPLEVAACLRTVVAHEIGHALGLLLHSSEPSDIMHSRPTAQVLSLRDVATLSTLYHSDPSVRLPATR